MNWKIVLAASIALGFLDLGELSSVQKAVAEDAVAAGLLSRRERRPVVFWRPGFRFHRSRAPAVTSLTFLFSWDKTQ